MVNRILSPLVGVVELIERRLCFHVTILRRFQNVQELELRHAFWRVACDVEDVPLFAAVAKTLWAEGHRWR